MRKIALAAALVAAALLAGATGARAQGDAPTKEHQWLQQLAGEWETDAEAALGPGQTLKCTGTESARSIGGFWIVNQVTSNVMGTAMHAVLTLGYDDQKKKYIGTWVDSTSNRMWRYEGSVDAAGKVLTLEADGPNPLEPGKTCKFRDVTELKSADRKVLTSSMQTADGKWVSFLTVNSRRKK
jgi:hypothetical protein